MLIYIHYGKTSEIASDQRDEQEMSVLCLRICQAALVQVTRPDSRGHGLQHRQSVST